MNGSAPTTLPALDSGPESHFALEVDDLHVHLGQSHVLQGVSFAAPSGGVTAVIGRNGVGKTTTLRGILGLAAGRGRVAVLGREVAGWPTHRIVQLGVGYVPEDRDVFSALTVRDNLRLAEAGSEPRYDEVFALFPELKQRFRQVAGTLSGGQQQMLALGRVLLNDSPLLLIDEPTKGLSPRRVQEVVEALERVHGDRTIVLIEQNVHVVRRLARRVVVLDQGRVVQSGDVDVLADEALVQRLLGVSGTR